MFPRNNNNIVFESVRLKNSNKQGVIKPDENGCYTQCIGALGAHNSSGDFYEFEAGRKFFLNQSAFQRRIGRGVLRSEYGHPKRQPGQDMTDFSRRIMSIDETLVCGTWRKIWLAKEHTTDDRGRKVVPIMGSIVPSGPYGAALKTAFDTPQEQVCFSIRSFTNDTMRPDGTALKKLQQIITFDYVNEPGMYVAEKLLSPTLESLDSEVVDPVSLLSAIKEDIGVSLESEGYVEFSNKLESIIENEKRKPNSFVLWSD